MASMKITAEVHFAQQLASNQQHVRDKALKKISKWLVVNSHGSKAITEEGLLKLWKGLYYYFWNCDKPLVQEEVAGVISKLIQSFMNVEYSFLFIDTFFQTMAREWFGIDRFRLEKFMMLIRKFLHESFQLLKRLKWELKFIKCLRKVLRKTVLSSKDDACPLGLKLHIVDIYMDELAKVGAQELTSRLVKAFLIPYCYVLVESENSALLSSVSKDVFLYLVNQDADEEEFHEFPILRFNATSVEKILMKFANKKTIKRKNMKIVYNIVKRFHDFKEEVSLSDKAFENQSSGAKLRKRAVEKAAHNLLTEDENFINEKLQWKKNKKSKLGDADDVEVL